MQGHALTTGEIEPPAAGIAGVYFDSVEAMQGALVSPKGEPALADLENAIDVGRPP